MQAVATSTPAAAATPTSGASLAASLPGNEHSFGSLPEAGPGWENRVVLDENLLDPLARAMLKHMEGK